MVSLSFQCLKAATSSSAPSDPNDPLAGLDEAARAVKLKQVCDVCMSVLYVCLCRHLVFFLYIVLTFFKRCNCS